MTLRSALSAATLTCVAATTALACASTDARPAGTFVRDADAPVIDAPAMSTGLDKRDLERMFAHLVADLQQSPFYTRATGAITILPLANETTEHIDRQLDALSSKIETQLVRDGALAVVSRERQATVIAEIDNQQQAAFDARYAARMGRMVGADYVVLGKVFDAAERTDDMRRVQYMAFVQVIELETDIVRWQGETDVTKAYLAAGLVDHVLAP